MVMMMLFTMMALMMMVVVVVVIIGKGFYLVTFAHPHHENKNYYCAYCELKRLRCMEICCPHIIFVQIMLPRLLAASFAELSALSKLASLLETIHSGLRG